MDVPHSLWSWNGLGEIAKAVGKPLSLDKQTALLKLMKYAGVLVELQYGASCPKSVWVPVINEKDNSVSKMKVDIEYFAIPVSCSYCRAFGHSDSRCEKNPSFMKKTLEATIPNSRGKPANENTVMGCPVEKDPTMATDHTQVLVFVP